jgi:iron(III) transport system substrate-binding protein
MAEDRASAATLRQQGGSRVSFIRSRAVGLACAVLLAGATAAGAQQLNVICSVQGEWCSALATEFQRETGVKVALTLKGSGESIAQLAAEKANPKLDIWFGGTGDPHLQAAEQELTAVYKSPLLGELQPWARRQAEQSGYRTVGIYLGLLGFGYNTELLTKKKATAPACWKDLVKPEYAGDVQMANPNASGTAYTAIATLVQLFGEEEAFRLLKGMHRNISNYPRQGVGPIKATARGENMIAVGFIHDVVTEAQAGFPVRSVAPCEGTGYEIGSLSIVKGARNPDAAKRFVDWALTAKAQALGAQNRQYQIPSNVNAAISPLAPKLSEVKLIDYDFARYGASVERKRLLERWDREVGSQLK